jgi:DNA primase
MDIAELKEQVTIEEVLAHFGANVGMRGGWSEWTAITCPFCSDSSGSASVNRAAGMFLCHQCLAPDRDNGKAGDIVDVVRYAESIRTVPEAVEWITRTFL